jgi:PPOX class probable F420-dependent enzyme
MDEPTMRRRVSEARVARLATVTAGDRPHIVPCCFVFDGEHDRIYSAVDGKPKSTLALRRLDNLRAHPHASLLVDHYDDDWSTLWWVRIDGSALAIDDGDERRRALALLAGKHRQYRTTPPTGTVIVINAEVWRAWP